MPCLLMKVLCRLESNCIYSRSAVTCTYKWYMYLERWMKILTMLILVVWRVYANWLSFWNCPFQIHHIVDRHNFTFYKYASSSMYVFLMILYNVLKRLSLLLQEYKSCLIQGHIILPWVMELSSLTSPYVRREDCKTMKLTTDSSGRMWLSI